MSSFIVVLVPLALAAWLTARFCDPLSKFHILDHPNERSLHTNPTPRSGGIAIFVAIALGFGGIGWGYVWPPELSWISASSLLVAVISYIDDRTSLEPIYRLVVHAAAAMFLLASGLMLQSASLPGMALPLPSGLSTLVSLFFIVWMINLYNFMDGMDGFAGGMAVIGFGTFAFLGWSSGHTVFCLTSLIVVAGSAGFLIFNFPPARIFMGDMGSSLLGLLAAALSLWGMREGVFPFWVSLLVFSPFIVDATFTLIRRILNGEKVWQAHRTHLYQRLVRIGWGHRKTVLWEYGLMVACSFCAVWVIRQPVVVQWVILAAWIVVYALIIVMVTRLEGRRSADEALT